MTKLEAIEARDKAARERICVFYHPEHIRASLCDRTWLLERVKELAAVARDALHPSGLTTSMASRARAALAALDEENP